MEPFFRRNRNLSYENQIQLYEPYKKEKINLLEATKKLLDIRIITATNEDLREAVKKGDLRRFVP
jgi:two-component system response regulator HydG